MKYILLNDINYVFRQKRKIIFSYFVIVLLYFVFNAIMRNLIDDKLFYDTLAISCNFSKAGWLEILMFIFSILIYLYIALQLFYKDIQIGIDNIYLRMTSIKWIRCKIVTIYIISVMLLCFMYSVLYATMYIVTKMAVSINFMIFIKHLIYMYTLESICLLFVLISNKIKILTPILILIFLSIFVVLPTDILSFNFYLLLGVCISINIMVFLIYKKDYIFILENIKGEII